MVPGGSGDDGTKGVVMMKPIEVMAKLRWERMSSRNGAFQPWESLSANLRVENIEDMRVALLALAEACYPDEIMQVGGIALDGMDVNAARAFRAMLLAIAETE